MNKTTMTRFERAFKIMTKPWVVAVCLGCFALSFLYLDQLVTIAAHGADLETKYPWLAALTKLGKKKTYFFVLMMVALTSRFLFKRILWEYRAWFLLICVTVANVVCLVLKVTFGRARPELFFSEHLYGFYGPHKNELYWSFPSGHTTTIMALMFGLSALFPRYILGFAILGSLVAVSRIMLIQHYLSDVLMATYLAFIEVGILYYWLTRYSGFLKIRPTLRNVDRNPSPDR